MVPEPGSTLLAVYDDEDVAYQAACALRDAGVGGARMSVLSPHPLPKYMFPVDEPRVPLQWWTIAGGAFGVSLALLLTVGTSYLYPIQTGHMPVLFSPPFAIIAYELMMLSAIVSTVGILAGLVLFQRFVQKKTLDDPAVHTDAVGLLVYCPDSALEQPARDLLGRSKPRTLKSAVGNHL